MLAALTHFGKQPFVNSRDSRFESLAVHKRERVPVG
jgi:hypothetical protein